MTDKQFGKLVNRRNLYQNKIDDHVKGLIKNWMKPHFHRGRMKKEIFAET